MANFAITAVVLALSFILIGIVFSVACMGFVTVCQCWKEVKSMRKTGK